jgi:hypothetical protein
MLPSQRGFILGCLPMRPAKGTAKQRKITSRERGPHSGPDRWMIHSCSQGSFPYQMTMYWEKKRYAQKIEKPNTSFPMSCF